MDKAQRKREAKARKARAKAAKKAKNQAKREAESTPGPAGDRSAALTAGGRELESAASSNEGPAPEGSEVVSGAVAGTLREPQGRQATACADEDVCAPEKPLHQMTNEELRADPELLEAVLASQHRDEESFELQDAGLDANRALDRARREVKEATAELPRGRRITDERALEMLEDAAEAVHEVLLMVRDTLRGVSPERREAARAILNEKPQSGVDGRKLPRRAPDPVVTLERLNLQAASLLKRILAKTNPGVGKKKAA